MITSERCLIRPWGSEDREDLVAMADDPSVWRNLAEPFPHPYTLDDADTWIERASRYLIPVRHMAITIGGTVAGGIGAEPLRGEREGASSFGYWLGRPHWGAGLATECGRAYLAWYVTEFRPRRLEANVYGWNPASARVLEKCGFSLEGRRSQAIVRGGEVTDDLMYGFVVDPSGRPAEG